MRMVFLLLGCLFLLSCNQQLQKQTDSDAQTRLDAQVGSKRGGFEGTKGPQLDYPTSGNPTPKAPEN
jgi:hypothetical protein